MPLGTDRRYFAADAPDVDLEHALLLIVDDTGADHVTPGGVHVLGITVNVDAIIGAADLVALTVQSTYDGDNWWDAGTFPVPAALVTGPIGRRFVVGTQWRLVWDVTMVDSAGTNEAQHIVVDATGGTFTLTFGGDTTDALDFNATAAQVAAALKALDSIGKYDVVVTGGPVNAGGVDVEFTHTLAFQNVAAITAVDVLTGGAGTVTITTPTPGVARDAVAVTVKVAPVH